MGLGISKLLVAALLGSSAFMQPAVLSGNAQRIVSQSKRKNITSTMFDEFGGYGGSGFSYPKRMGWSKNRMAKRMAMKARNQKRNRRAHKGGA